MSNKKLLSEAQVRRFMGLAGIRPLNEMTSGALDEVDLEEKRRKTEEMHGDDDKKKEMKEMGNYKEDDMNEMAAYKEDDEMEGDVDVEMEEALVDEFKDAVETIKKVEAALSGGAMEDEEDDMDMDMDKEEDDMDMDMMDDKEEEGDEDMADLEEELMEVDMELTEDEIVSEVARRVAKRIVEAKRAHKKMNEALGRKK